jgi:hypothetical protein
MRAEIAREYPRLMKEIAINHPEYFVSTKIAVLCIEDLRLLDIVGKYLGFDDSDNQVATRSTGDDSHTYHNVEVSGYLNSNCVVM